MDIDKKITYILAGLYLATLAAALVILVRTPAPAPVSETALKAFAGLPKLRETGDAVYVIDIYGPIRSARAGSRRAASPERIVKRLRDATLRDDVKAIVLRIDSPGGTVAATQEIFDEVMNARKAGKIVVASMGDIAASGGYYIAAGADKIVANPGTLTGSVGVIFELMQAQELFKKIGVKIETVKSGKYKDTGSLTREITPEERALLQGIINDAYDQFVSAIVRGRGTPREKVLEFADGRIFTGAQAKNSGIVDELGNRNDALDLAAKLSGIEGKPRIITERDPWEEFLQYLEMSQFSRLDLPASAQAAAARLGMGVRFEYMME